MPQTKRILCADDSQDIRDMLKALLGAHGYEVECAASPVAVLDRAQRGGYALYLIETSLSMESSLDLCAALGERTPHVPVVFYTTAAREAEREAGLCAGAAAYVVKPEVGELVETVRRLLGE